MGTRVRGPSLYARCYVSWPNVEKLPKNYAGPATWPPAQRWEDVPQVATGYQDVGFLRVKAGRAGNVWHALAVTAPFDTV
jgi:hypothetical protein